MCLTLFHSYPVPNPPLLESLASGWSCQERIMGAGKGVYNNLGMKSTLAYKLSKLGRIDRAQARGDETSRPGNELVLVVGTYLLSEKRSFF